MAAYARGSQRENELPAHSTNTERLFSGRKRGDVAPVIPVGHEIEAGEAPPEAGEAEAPKSTIRVKRAVATGAVATKDAKGTSGRVGERHSRPGHGRSS